MTGRADEQHRILSRLRTAHRVAGIGSWEGRVRPGGQELDWSPEVHEIAGWPEGRTPSYREFVSLVHPDDRPGFLESSAAALAGDRPYRMDVRLVRPDGGVRHVHIAAEVLRGPDGRAERLIGVLQDRTDEIETVRRLRITEASRRQLLERLLDAADHERDRLARHLAAGPLEELRGVETTMAAAIDDDSPADWVAALESVRRSIASLNATVSSFAEEPTRRDLAGVITDLAADAGTDLDVETEVAVSGALRPAVRAVVVRLVQEALQNARKHAGASAASVTVRAAGAEVHVRVADDGCGFDPEAVRGRRGHFGLTSLRDDVAAVGGSLHIGSGPSGTVVEATLPTR